MCKNKKILNNFTTERYGLEVRMVQEYDAEFILSLRLDYKHSRYISKTDTNLENQQKWIAAYKERECAGLEYYFVFSLNNIPIGVYRLYDIRDKSFICGSWVFSPDAPLGAGILGCIIGREIAYENLELEKCFTDVVKNNISSMKFQLAFNPIILKEENGSVYFEHIKENFYNIKPRFIKTCITLLKRKINE